MNEINTLTDCLNLIDTSIVQITYLINIDQLEEIHNFLINLFEMKFIENTIVISNVLKYINYMIDEYQSLDIEEYETLRKVIIDIMVENNAMGDIKKSTS